MEFWNTKWMRPVEGSVTAPRETNSWKIYSAQPQMKLTTQAALVVRFQYRP